MLIWEYSLREHEGLLTVLDVNTIFTSKLYVYFNVGGNKTKIAIHVVFFSYLEILFFWFIPMYVKYYLNFSV